MEWINKTDRYRQMARFDRARMSRMAADNEGCMNGDSAKCRAAANGTAHPSPASLASTLLYFIISLFLTIPRNATFDRSFIYGRYFISLHT